MGLKKIGQSESLSKIESILADELKARWKPVLGRIIAFEYPCVSLAGP